MSLLLLHYRLTRYPSFRSYKSNIINEYKIYIFIVTFKPNKFFRYART